jgi:hypothetical protein
LQAAAVATDIGTHRGSRDRATGCGDVLPAPAADLVAENSADDGAGNCSGYIRITALLNDLLAFDPASLLGRADHRPDRGDVRLE